MSGPERGPTLEQMLRTLLMASALYLSATLFACGSGSNGGLPTLSEPLTTPLPTALVRVSPQPKPTDVPPAATPIVETSILGKIVPQADATPQVAELRALNDASCENDLLTIHTSEETIFAKLSCDLFANDRFDPYFAGKQAALVLGVEADRFRIVIDTIDGAHAEFTPEGIWVQ